MNLNSIPSAAAPPGDQAAGHLLTFLEPGDKLSLVHTRTPCSLPVFLGLTLSPVPTSQGDVFALSVGMLVSWDRTPLNQLNEPSPEVKEPVFSLNYPRRAS